jgi:hypothetical protein
MRWTTRAAGTALAATILCGGVIGVSRPAGAQVNPLSSEVPLQAAAGATSWFASSTLPARR